MSSHLRKFLVLKNNYRKYDSKHTIKRMQAWRENARKLGQNGYRVAIELLGSMDFGISNEDSDIDCVLMFFCDEHHADPFCPEDCKNLVHIRDQLAAFNRHGERIEVLDWVNLRKVEEFIERRNYDEIEVVFPFLYYRGIGRPINSPLIARYGAILERDKKVKDGCNAWASEALKVFLSTSTHANSFEKYNNRLVRSGLPLSEGLKRKLDRYLR